MRSLRALVLSGAVLTSGLFGGLGCDSIDAAFDCHDVCTRYQQCYDSTYDVGKCEDNCRTRAANDPSVQNDADKCDACIGDKSCLSATFNCAGDCGAIVP